MLAASPGYRIARSCRIAAGVPSRSWRIRSDGAADLQQQRASPEGRARTRSTGPSPSTKLLRVVGKTAAEHHRTCSPWAKLSSSDVGPPGNRDTLTNAYKNSGRSLTENQAGPTSLPKSCADRSVTRPPCSTARSHWIGRFGASRPAASTPRFRSSRWPCSRSITWEPKGISLRFACEV